MSERIFGPYNDGHGEVYADPFRVFLSLVRLLDGDPESVNRQAKERPPVDGSGAEAVANWRLMTAEAQQRLADAAREAFEMAAFDKLSGTGATDEQCGLVLDQFLAYMDTLKKSTALTPTSPPPTAPLPLSVPGLSPATNDLPCGSC